MTNAVTAYLDAHIAAVFHGFPQTSGDFLAFNRPEVLQFLEELLVPGRG